MNKKRISALLLTGIMTLSMGTGVFAQGDAVPPSVNNGKTVSITKNFEMAEGLSTPNVMFKFTAENVTIDGPKATIREIVYAPTDVVDKADGKITISKKSNIEFDAEFPHAGVYEYRIKETSENIEGITYSTDVYYLRVYVKNTEQGLLVDKMTAEKGTETGNAQNKVAEMQFINIYRKDAKLEITKNTKGDFADKKKKFDFKIKLYPSKTETNPNPTYEGKIGNQTINVSCGEQGVEFKLADGESLVFDKLPVGTRYVVEEIGAADGYTPSVNVIENAEATVQNKTAQEAEGLTSVKEGTTNNLVGENENKVTFTNTYKDVPITGVIMNNLPFIAVIGVALVALISLAVIKKQRGSRR